MILGASFGIVMAILKGHDAGVRYVIGNLAAPWLVLPFLAGRATVRLPPAALMGCATALASLLAFYATTSSLYHQVNEHTRANNLFFVVVSMLAGVASGLLGGYARRNAPAGLVLLGLAFALEPVGQFAIRQLQRSVLTVAALVVSVVELAAGALLIVFALMACRRTDVRTDLHRTRLSATSTKDRR